MKVLYDYQAFYMQRYGGVSNCFVQLISNLPSSAQYQIALRESDNEHLIASALLNVEPTRLREDNFLLNKHFKGRERLYGACSRYFPSLTSLGRNRIYAKRILSQGKFDIFHPTYFDDYFLKYLHEIPFVLTIHDMIPERLGFPEDMQTRNKRRLAHLASHIIAVSEYTKNDIIELLHVPSSKISVIYHGAPEYNDVQGCKPLFDGKYILFVGRRDSYKNFIPMIDAIAPVLKKYEDLFVLCTGPEFTPFELSHFKSKHIIKHLVHMNVKDEELGNLYSNALFFIYPSLYEGFGIPILEAYKSNCPVMLNNKSCFAEIAGDSAIYFVLDECQSNLESVIDSFLCMTDEEKRRLLCRQRDRLNAYSWKKSAEKLVKVYESVLRKS